MNRNIHITEDRSKNTDEHDIYLSDFAIKHLNAIIEINHSETWLFPGNIPTQPLTNSTVTKQITDRQSDKLKQGKKLKKRAYDNSLDLPGGRWIVHDLRRTAATIMQKLGVLPHVIKKCLNQRSGDIIIETYQQDELVEEQKAAFIKLGKYLEEMLG